MVPLAGNRRARLGRKRPRSAPLSRLERRLEAMLDARDGHYDDDEAE
jgi:hypothetical protein